MSDRKPKTIPQWQRQESKDLPTSESPEAAPTTKENAVKQELTAEETNSLDSRSELVSQAAEFLKHDDIKDQPNDKKVSFLESKGLTNSEIHSLLGLSRNEESDSQVLEPIATTTPSTDPTSTTLPKEPSLSTKETSISSSSTTSPSKSETSQQPIITYPEFLLHSSKPAPLITRQGIWNTIYFSSLAAGITYSANKLLLTPLLDSLTSARHDIYETTNKNVKELNEKLTSTVSTVPIIREGKKGNLDKGDGKWNGEDEVDNSSEASDPTELFHRDIGIQTSPPLSPIPTAGTTTLPTSTSKTSTSTQLNSLTSLKSHLSTLHQTSTTSLEVETETRNSILELQGYLEDMAYGRSSSSSTGGLWSREGVLGTGDGKGKGGGNVDEVAKLKAEVRSFKGVLLSARSFPVPGGVR